MKNKIGICVALVVIGIIVFGSSQVFRASSATSVTAVSIDLEKKKIIPGEAVSLTLRVDNVAKGEIRNVKLLVAFEDGSFKEYRPPQTSTPDPFMDQLRVESDGTIRSGMTILYHRLEPTSHLSEMYAKPIQEKELNDFWALNTPGSYRIKAVAVSSRGGDIESDEVMIEVAEPVGADAVIWESIRGSKEAARMMHTGDDLSERAGDFENRATFESLVASYPESVYAKQLVRNKDR